MNKNELEKTEVKSSSGKVSALIGKGWGGVLMEQDVRVAVGTADIETGQLLIIKHCLCLSAFSNYKCLKFGFFSNSAVYFSLFYNKWLNSCMPTVVFISILQEKKWFSSLSLGHSAVSFTVGVITRDKGKWLRAHLTAFTLSQQIIILSARKGCNISSSSLRSEFRNCMILRLLSKSRKF